MGGSPRRPLRIFLTRLRIDSRKFSGSRDPSPPLSAKAGASRASSTQTPSSSVKKVMLVWNPADEGKVRPPAAAA